MAARSQLPACEVFLRCTTRRCAWASLRGFSSPVRFAAWQLVAYGVPQLDDLTVHAISPPRGNYPAPADSRVSFPQRTG